MEEAETIYKAFFQTMAHYNHWRERYKHKARQQGYSETHFGRRRVIHSYILAKYEKAKIEREITSAAEKGTPIPEFEQKAMYRNYFRLLTQGDREAVNHRIQGTCLDILKLAAHRIRKHFINTGQWMSDVIPMMCVHDELNFAVKGPLVGCVGNDGQILNYEICDPIAKEIINVIKGFMTTRPEGFILDMDSSPEIGYNWKELKTGKS